MPLDIIRFFNHVEYEYAGDAYDVINSTLMYLVDHIDEINEGNYKQQNKARMQFLQSPDFYSFLNEMPDSFVEFRDSISASIINLTVRLQNIDNYFVKGVSRPLRQLQCEPINMNIIKGNHKAFHSQKSIEDINWKWGIAIGIGFMLLKWLLKSL